MCPRPPTLLTQVLFVCTAHTLDIIPPPQVLFVCTANTLDTIPGPLLDRMEVIRLSGYASDEKRAIARRYLEPTAAADAGAQVLKGCSLGHPPTPSRGDLS